jgi:hypothetical protein
MRGGNTMRLEITEHERNVIVGVLMDVNTVISLHLANKILAQTNGDPTTDGPEVNAIRHLRQLESWDA